MTDVRKLPTPNETNRTPPKRIMRPCEWGLLGSVRDLETQLGSVGAYNALCEAAEKLKTKIDAGEGKAAHARWSTDPDWIYPAGMR